MRTCRDIEPLLSLLVDGLLADDAQAEVRAHVRECPACRGLLTDLERLRSTARSLGPIAPASAAWHRIEDRLKVDATVPDAPVLASGRRALLQWFGLAAALLLVTAVVYVARGRVAPADQSADGTATTVDGVAAEVGRATASYERAIRELETAAATTDDGMAPAVVAVVRTNMGAIDTAIADSQAALEENPESESARTSLFEALRRKIALLQTTVTLINDMRAGNEEGAAQAAEQLGKQS
ncbi:MAG: zf-HC2 domain-containing protein [Acidobacteria bacterium]|nr:zf-HC2 domain-containing protein [Acidobacteriota bacterium]